MNALKKTIILLMVIEACAYFSPKSHIFPKANVILISLDTTRSDHLSCYGYGKKISPNIDRFSEDGIVFYNAISQVPLTLPSHASVFTGLLPTKHKIRDNGGYYLNKEYKTIAEILSGNGYFTAGIIASFVLNSKWGISQGFQFYDDEIEEEIYRSYSSLSAERPANIVVHKAINFLNQKNTDKPLFLFLHFFDPHAPYNKHSEFNAKFNLPYDQEIAFMDKYLGIFFSYLKKKGLYDKSIIILFGDHGEGLGEHDEIGHGIFLYDSTLKVPLIIKLPNSILKGLHIQDQVRLVDLFPTILDFLNIPRNFYVDGESLALTLFQKKIAKENFAYSETYYPLIHYGWSPLFSIRSNSFKFVYAPKKELYNIQRDPKEKKNLNDLYTKISMDYFLELKKHGNYDLKKFNMPSNLSIEEQEKLIALGYAATSISKLNQAKLEDPKDKIKLLKNIEKAKEYYYEGKKDRAINLLEFVIKEDKNIMTAWFLLGNWYAKNQDYESAIKAFREVINIDSSNSFALFNLANAYQHIRNYQEAIFWYKKAIEKDKSFFKAYVNLGELLFFTNRFGEALDYFKKALNIRRDFPQVYNYLSGIYLQQNDIEKAKENAYMAKRINPNLPLLNFHIGLIYEKEDKIEEAIEAYKKEIEINPDNYSAFNNLGILYAKQKRYREAEEIFRYLIKLRENDWRFYLLLANILYKKGGSPTEIQNLVNKAEQLKSKTIR